LNRIKNYVFLTLMLISKKNFIRNPNRFLRLYNLATKIQGPFDDRFRSFVAFFRRSNDRKMSVQNVPEITVTVTVRSHPKKRKKYCKGRSLF